MALFLLWLLWFVHHLIERPTGTVLWKVEYYKWAYSVVRWVLPLFMGLLFPVSAEHVQRFLRATAVVGLATCGLMIVAYFGGLADISQYAGYRYSISEKAGSGYVGAAAIGTGALLGGYLVCQGRLTTRRIVFVVVGLLGMFFAVGLSGTRSTVLILPLVVLAGRVFISVQMVLYAALGALLVDLAVLYFAVKIFQRETILTRWK